MSPVLLLTNVLLEHILYVQKHNITGQTFLRLVMYNVKS